MAKFTRQAIMYSTLKLLQVKPIDKITVRDICDQCELTRNTFYYYFSDIYEMVEELLKFETDKSLSEQQEFDSLYDAYLQKYHLVLEYKNAVYHLYNSKNRDMILRYLYDITEDFVGKYVRNEVRGHHLSEDDIHFITRFYSGSMIGSILRWLQEGMKDSQEEIIYKISMAYQATIQTLIQQIEASKKPN